MTQFDVHEAVDDGIQKKTMAINSWSISTTKGRIFDSKELIEASTELSKQIPFPDMFFGHNSLIIEHSNGFKCSFTALDAFRQVGLENDLKVSVSSAWINSRKSDTENLKIVKPYDWTFTTLYDGDAVSLHFTNQDVVEDINIHLLKQPDPILFYEFLPLYEDELGDNGSSELSVRIRVMPKCFLILLRFFLRVDNVVFRIFDTRYFHEWNQDFVIKEISHSEIPYNEALQILRNTRFCSQTEGEDLSLLSDSQFISSLLDKTKHLIRFSKEKYRI